MKIAYAPVLAVLFGLAAATVEKRRPGVECGTGGKALESTEGCKKYIEELRANGPDSESTLTDDNDGREGCETGCGVIVNPRSGRITIRRSEIANDVQKIIDQCAGDGPFSGTFAEESGDLARRTEVFDIAGSEACEAAESTGGGPPQSTGGS